MYLQDSHSDILSAESRADVMQEPLKLSNGKSWDGGSGCKKEQNGT
jgi:hypothetical protein